MTGLRSRIAKAVVNSLLDTLTENDYVNVFKFSDQTEVLVDCTNDTGNPILIQVSQILINLASPPIILPSWINSEDENILIKWGLI